MKYLQKLLKMNYMITVTILPTLPHIQLTFTWKHKTVDSKGADYGA
jgi:hypothetical protein